MDHAQHNLCSTCMPTASSRLRRSACTSDYPVHPMNRAIPAGSAHACPDRVSSLHVIGGSESQQPCQNYQAAHKPRLAVERAWMRMTINGATGAA